MRESLGPRGLAPTQAMIGIVKTNCTMALNKSTSEGSIRRSNLTITEQSVKNNPETAAKKIPMNLPPPPLVSSFFSSRLS